MEKLIDLSHEIHKDAPVFPAHPRPLILPYATHEETRRELGSGFSFQSRLLQMSDHMGTHVDAFCHVDPDPAAPDISQMPLELFWGPALCIDVSTVPSRGYIRVSDLEQGLSRAGLSLQKGDILLLYSGHFQRTQERPEYLTEYAGPDEAAARWLVGKGIKALGFDTPSADHPEDPSFPVHTLLVRNRIVVIENLANLEAVVNRRFRFFGLPLRIRGATGSPIRAFALLEG
jgi:kynurenine formamidase